MKTRIKMFVLPLAALAVLFVFATSARAFDTFPADPKGAKIIDRAYHSLVSLDYYPANYYAVIYNKSGAGWLEVFEQRSQDNDTWRNIKKWKITENCTGGKSIKLGPRDIVYISESANELFFGVVPEDGFVRPAALRFNLYERDFEVDEQCHD